MSAELRHFIAFVALAILVVGAVAWGVAAARRRKAVRRAHSQRVRIDLLTGSEHGD